MHLEPPYLLFLGDVARESIGTEAVASKDVADVGLAKTAAGLRDWVPEKCLGQLRLPGCAVDLGLPDLSPEEAAARGAKTLIIGIANIGGYIEESWVPLLVRALESGLDVAAGLHARLLDVDVLRDAATRTGRRLLDVRHTDQQIPMATGELRSGNRVLTVGTDCAIGKKFTALALTREFERRGVPVDFRATGQTGIMIAGRGIAVDAIKSDFIAGAAEWLAPANDAAHWDIIEGQGSLYHPAYAAVTLGLLHGAQPQHFVLCHEPTRRHIAWYKNHPIPALAECIEMHVRLGRITSPKIRCAGISINASRMNSSQAVQDYKRATERELNLPCVDPRHDGVARLADVLLG